MPIRYYVIISVFSILLLGSCVSVKKELARYEKYDGKTLLYQQKIKGKTKTEKYLLKEYYSQNENRPFIIPGNKGYLKAYFIGRRRKFLFFKPYQPEKTERKVTKTEVKYNQKIEKAKKDKRKVKLSQKRDKKLNKLRSKLDNGNWMMSVVGEEPVVFDSIAYQNTKKQFTKFLHSQGFFHCSITGTVKQKGFKTKIEYRIEENQPHILDAINYNIEDPELEAILNKSIDNTLLVSGDRYIENNITAERERINRLMKDNGYFKFNRKYISFRIDTLSEKYKANIQINIENPKEGVHTKYTIRNVQFTVDGNEPGIFNNRNYDSISYKYHDKRLPFKTLDHFIKIRPGEIYSLSDAEKTQRILGSKDIYKFINISYQEADSATLNVYTNANTLYKYQFTTEVGANVNLSEGQNLPGPFFNVSLKDRKIFNGFEILELNFRYSYQQQPTITAETESLRSIELGTNLSLTFPTILIPTKLRYKFNDFASKTVMSIGYTKSDRIEYNRDNIEFAFNYKWTAKQFHYYAVSPITISVVNTRDIIERFQLYLDELEKRGNNLKQSFEPSIITSINTSYIYNDNDLTRNIRAKFIKLFVESGGLLANTLGTTDSESGDDISRIAGLPYYQYYKFQIDHRQYFPISRHNSIASRVTLGYASPFGNSNILPYDKFFFSGGLNSIRAWPLKRLGPGEFVLTDGNGDPSYQFEQPGEIFFEYNLELRSKIIGFINGALFLDIGNVWTREVDPARPGAEFLFDKFYKQMAVGTGAGLRFDFSFLIFRFDLGIKVWDPARKIIVPFNDKYKYVFNFGIGYSF